MMEPERLQYASRKQESSLKVGMIVAAIWTLGQFGISEVLYRLGDATGVDALYDLSDTVAWPAGLLYNKAEVAVFREGLERLESTPEERARWDALLQKVEESDDNESYDAIWEIFNTHSMDPYVDMMTEYSIYVGVCAVWGSMIGILVSFVHFTRKGL